VNGLGPLFSPFASIVLQAINYRRAGFKRDMRACWLWFVGLCIAGVIWSQVPLPGSRDARLIYNFLFTFATWAVWLVAYGRKHRRKLGQLPGEPIEYRSALSAFGLAFVIWLVTALLVGLFVVGLDHLRA